MKWYILEGKEVRLADSFEHYIAVMSNVNPIVKRSKVLDVTVSTVFLGLDHSFYKKELPLLFETMIFGGRHDGYQNRYSTWDEAVKGHLEAYVLADVGTFNDMEDGIKSVNRIIETIGGIEPLKT